MYKQMYHKTTIVEFMGNVASRTSTVEGKANAKGKLCFLVQTSLGADMKSDRYKKGAPGGFGALNPK